MTPGATPWATCSTDAATKTAFDNSFMLAGTTGVSVLFSSGDSGDNFSDFRFDRAGLSTVQPVCHRRWRHRSGSGKR